MKTKNRLALLYLATALCLGGCSKQDTPSAKGGASVGYGPYDEAAEMYYDYFRYNNHVAMLLGDETGGPGFSDAEMAAYAIGELHLMGVYNYERGNPATAYDAVTEKYFGTTIGDFNNSKSTVLPDGNVTSTGWGGHSVYLVLRDLLEADSLTTATFYQLSFGMDDKLPTQEALKDDLLGGRFDKYGAVWIIEMDFEVQQYQNGAVYLLYRDVRPLGVAEGPFEVYSEE